MRSVGFWIGVVIAWLGWVGGAVLAVIVLEGIDRPWYVDVPVAAFLAIIVTNHVFQYQKKGGPE